MGYWFVPNGKGGGNKNMMPEICKIANAKSDINNFITKISTDYDLQPYLIVGILSEILLVYKNYESDMLNMQFNEILKTINEVREQQEKGEDK